MLLLSLDSTSELIGICVAYPNFHDVFAANPERIVRTLWKKDRLMRTQDLFLNGIVEAVFVAIARRALACAV